MNDQSIFNTNTICNDWKLYKLILFNLVQNSIKYNKVNNGDIFIILTCKPLYDS